MLDVLGSLFLVCVLRCALLLAEVFEYVSKMEPDGAANSYADQSSVPRHVLDCPRCDTEVGRNLPLSEEAFFGSNYGIGSDGLAHKTQRTTRNWRRPPCSDLLDQVRKWAGD